MVFKVVCSFETSQYMWSCAYNCTYQTDQNITLVDCLEKIDLFFILSFQIIQWSNLSHIQSFFEREWKMFDVPWSFCFHNLVRCIYFITLEPKWIRGCMKLFLILIWWWYFKQGRLVSFLWETKRLNTNESKKDWVF